MLPFLIYLIFVMNSFIWYISSFFFFEQIIWGFHIWKEKIPIVVVVQSPSHVRLCDPMGPRACKALLSFTTSWSLLSFMCIESVMLFNNLILCCPLLLFPSVFPSIRAFSNESALHIRWPKYWSFSFIISPSNKYSRLIFLRIDWLDLLVA